MRIQSVIIKCRSCWLLAALALVGCQPSEPLGKVHGSVKVGGAPVTRGLVVFANPEKGIYMTAVLNELGNYEMLAANGVGLPLGSYKIAVTPPLPEPPLPALPGGTSYSTRRVSEPSPIPTAYRRYETSGLTIVVNQGDTLFNIDM